MSYGDEFYDDELYDDDDGGDAGEEWAVATFELLEDLEAHHGRRLSSEERIAAMHHTAAEYGFPPESVEAIQDEELVDRLGANIGSLERQLGRTFTDGEVDGIAVQFADMDPADVGIEGVEAAHKTFWKEQGRDEPDMAKQSDRRSFMFERLTEEREAPQYEKKLSELDQDNRAERQEFMVRRAAGEVEQEEPEAA